MKFRIEWTPEDSEDREFVEREFEDKDQAEAYAEKYCPGKDHNIEEVKDEGKNQDL